MKKFKGKKMPDGGKMLRYEKVKNATGGVYLSPVFEGNWSDFDRRSTWKSIPDNMSGIPVMKGENYMDISKGVVSNGPAVIQQQETPLWGQNIIQDHGSVHYQGQMPNQWSQQTPAQKQEGGALPSAAYGMSMKNNYGFPPSMMQGFDNGLAMQQNQPVQLEGATVSATRGNTIQSNPLHMMNTDQQPMAAPQAVDPNQTLDGSNAGMVSKKPKKKGWGFTTPGTGDMVAGAIGIANALMPEEEQNPSYHRPQYGGYNANAFGNGSQALYADGGTMPSDYRGFMTNLGMSMAGAPAVYPMSPKVNSSTPITAAQRKLLMSGTSDRNDTRATLVDKGTNQMFLGQHNPLTNETNLDAYEVLTGADYRNDILSSRSPFTKGLATEDNSSLVAGKETPVGDFPLKYKEKSVEGLPGYHMLGTEKTHANMESSIGAFHYVFDPANRGKLFNNNNAQDNYKTFGCVNCDKKGHEKLVELQGTNPGSANVFNSKKSYANNQINSRLNKRFAEMGVQGSNQYRQMVDKGASASKVLAMLDPAYSAPVATPRPTSEPVAQTSSYKGNSVVDFLNQSGRGSSKAERAKLAKQFGISDYKGSAAQNIKLLNSLRGKMEDGGYFPGGVHEVKRRVGGFGVTEEIPNMLGKYPVMPEPIVQPIKDAVPAYQKPSITYEKLEASPGMKGSVWNPVYNGMTPGQIRNAQQFLPSQIAGNEVLRGEAGKDVMSPINYNSARPLFMDTPAYEPINWHPTYGSNMDYMNDNSMAMGGKLAKGQKVKLTVSQKAALEQQGYKFE